MMGQRGNRQRREVRRILVQAKLQIVAERSAADQGLSQCRSDDGSLSANIVKATPLESVDDLRHALMNRIIMPDYSQQDSPGIQFLE